MVVTWLSAIGANLSALWILIANGWMQNPVGAKFNYETMRMEVTSFKDVIFNPVAQAKFVHTVSAGYVTGAVFVLSISAWYLLKGRNKEFARRSIAVAASFGLAAALSVVVLGDESGYVTTQHQKMKIAAIESAWNTESAPASFTLFGIPDMQAHETRDAIKIPWMLGLIATRSLDTQLPGIHELVDQAKVQIAAGIKAYDALERVRTNRNDVEAKATLEANVQDLGYALLLKRYVDDPRKATPDQIERAAWSTVPDVPVLFWSFRIMVGLGFFFIALFAVLFVITAKRRIEQYPRLLRLALYSLPLPWIAAELGWVVAEYGRQPWVIEGILPTFMGVSSVSTTQVSLSLIGFVVFYSALAVVELFLMFRIARGGPDGWFNNQHANNTDASSQPANS